MIVMPRAQDIDRETRARLLAWLNYFFKRQGGDRKDFARWLGVSPASVTQYLNGKRTIGLDTFLKMSTKGRRSLDELADSWPPGHEEDSPPGPTGALTMGTGTRGRRTRTGAGAGL
jgi:transcriptional regulator with XRE-family HTH domain